MAGGGPFNNYNAANFKVDVQALASRPTLPAQLTEEQRQVHLATKDGKAMDQVAEPTINFPDVANLTARTQDMLSRSVVSTVLSDLTDNPSVASWVSAGLPLHRGLHMSTNCRFCDQPLPELRVQQLEAHFNNEFKRFISDAENLVSEIQAAREFSNALRAPPKEALYANFRPAYEKAMSNLTQQAGLVPVALDVLLRALQSKRDEPFKTFELTHFITNATADGRPAGASKRSFR